MKKETIKEFGKLIYDFSKIGLAVAIITPLAKNEVVSFQALTGVMMAIVIGTYIINKGSSNG